MYCLLKMGIFHCYVSLPKGSIKSCKAAFPTLPNMFVNITFLASNKGLTQASAKEHQFRKQTRHGNAVRDPPCWAHLRQSICRSINVGCEEGNQTDTIQELWFLKLKIILYPPQKKNTKKHEKTGKLWNDGPRPMSSQKINCYMSGWRFSVGPCPSYSDQSLAGRWNHT